MSWMDWNKAVETNREALMRILAMLFAMAGLDAHGLNDGARRTLPRHLHRVILRILRPAESALRRLIIVAARNVAPPPVRPRRTAPAPQPGYIEIHPSNVVRNGRGTGIVLPPNTLRRIGPDGRVEMYLIPKDNPAPIELPRRKKPRAARRMAFPLFDPLRNPFPRRTAARRRHIPHTPPPGDLVDAGPLGRRLATLASALDDLDGQALRFARWRARRDAAGPATSRRPRRFDPLRRGLPPGARKRDWLGPESNRRPSHEVHDVLHNLDGLARWSMEPRDTS